VAARIVPVFIAYSAGQLQLTTECSYDDDDDDGEELWPCINVI